MTHALAAGLRAFVEELVGAGLREAVVCPGSRSTPMALALAAHDALRVHVLLDERSAAFAALGMARAAQRPVAVLVTSGTAAAELLPAAAEANLAHVPLLLLTADRPPELRDRGAAQTIDQVGILGAHGRWAAEVPLMDGAPETIGHWRWLAGRAMAEARGTGLGAGPVHLDLPYREPLLPDGPLGPGPEPWPGPMVRLLEAPRSAGTRELGDLERHMRETPRGLIVAGPDTGPETARQLGRLSRATGYPLLSDGLAASRAQGVGTGDLLARPGPWIERHRPELVIRAGAIPTSRWVNELVGAPGHALWVVDDVPWRQPAGRPSTLILAQPATVFEALTASMDAEGPPADATWSADWAGADRTLRRALDGWIGGLDEPFEGLPFHLLADLAREPTLVWVGSSMPVRDLDVWFTGSERVQAVASRGANGIDGVTSAAAGAAAVDDWPVLLVTGDVSFVHDAGGLVTARLLGVPLTVLVIDNDGGGIFSFLAQAAADRPDIGLPARFEHLFGTPHGTRIAELATALGAEARDVDHRTLEPALRAALADRSPGVRLLRYASDRQRNLALHREAAAVAAQALDALVGDG